MKSIEQQISENQEEMRRLRKMLWTLGLSFASLMVLLSVVFKPVRPLTCEEQRGFISVNPQALLFIDTPECK